MNHRKRLKIKMALKRERALSNYGLTEVGGFRIEDHKTWNRRIEKCRDSPREEFSYKKCYGKFRGFTETEDKIRDYLNAEQLDSSQF